MGQVVGVVVQLQARLGIAAAIVVVVVVVVVVFKRAALPLETAGREGLEGLCLIPQHHQLLEVEPLETQVAHQTVVLEQQPLPALLVALVVGVVQVIALLLATEARAAIPVVAVVAAVLATQSTPVLVAMVATAMSVS
jgi:hypothetical protein